MIEKAIAFLDSLNSEELDRLPPARRQKCAALCHHWWRLAKGPPKEPKAGVLGSLKAGERGE
jgi:hypothetical protein